MKKLCIALMFGLSGQLFGIQPTGDQCSEGKIAVTILTDESELTPNGPVGISLNSALRDQSSLMVVSNHLLYANNYFSHPAQPNWLAYRISPYVSLLIPKDLAARYRTRDKIPPAVDDNYVLGITFPQQLPLHVYDLNDSQITPPGLAQKTMPKIINLFIPRQEYQKKWPNVPPRRFMLFFIGHGSPFVFREISPDQQAYSGGAVAAFPYNNIRYLITTLAGKYSFQDPEQTLGRINIVALFFLSCGIGDTQIRAILKENQDFFTTYDFPFPIVIATPLTSGVHARAGGQDFKKFYAIIENACSLATGNQEVLLQAADAVYATQDASLAAEIPLVKFPGISQFFPLNSRDFVEIGMVLGSARREPLIIPDYFKKSAIRAVLVHAPEMPFKISIKPMPRLPYFFSAEPGPQIHQFTGEFDASPYTFTQVISAFTPVTQYQWKAFTFKTLIAQDDVIYKNRQVRAFTDVAIINTLEDTGPESQRPVIWIIYTYENRAWYYFKKITSDNDAVKFGTDTAIGSIPAQPDALKYFLDQILKMRRTSLPGLASPHVLDPLYTVINKKITEARAPDIERLAESLKILAQ